MTYLRILCTTTAGIGYFYGSTINKLRKHTFKVKAAQHPDVNPHIGSRFTKYGLPQRDVILRYKRFETSFDNRNRMPNWILEHLTYKNLHTRGTSLGCKIDISTRLDPRVDKDFQPDLIDFEHNICRLPLNDFANYPDSLRSIYDCHYRTNSAPQNCRLHPVWNDLESYCRYLTCEYTDVYIYTGPVFQSTNQPQMYYQVSSVNHLAYPTHYYKIIIGRKDDVFHLGCYLLPNRAIDLIYELSDFRVPLSVIEEKGGFKLFKDGFTLPETLVNINDFRRRKQVYMPGDYRNDLALQEGNDVQDEEDDVEEDDVEEDDVDEDDVEEDDVEQNGHVQNGGENI
uniref:DNA/RNA non-specific endonuclease domain-containing protein n=1 Tax=Strigamia maritima TaxID=126957 RepID=T1IK91_STRMM